MIDEARALLHKAHQSLQAARLLNEQGYVDIAASRAHYAMFYTAQALLLQHGHTYSSHSAVIAGFGKEMAKTGILDPRYHRHLIDGQDLRNLADYGIGTPLMSDQMHEMMGWAAELLAEAERMLPA